MSQHEADLEFSFGKDGVQSHQDENAGIRFDCVLHFHVFHHKNKFKPNKQIRLGEFVFLFSPKPSQYVTFFVCRFASREADRPTRTVGKTEAKQQETHLAWCVCCVEKGSCERCFRFAELLTTFQRVCGITSSSCEIYVCMSSRAQCVKLSCYNQDI